MSNTNGYNLATTYTSVYIVCTHRSSQKIADFENSTMTATPNWLDASLILIKNPYNQMYPIDLAPYKEWLLSGIYDVCIYKIDGTEPATTDTIIGKLEIDYEKDNGTYDILRVSL